MILSGPLFPHLSDSDSADIVEKFEALLKEQDNDDSSDEGEDEDHDVHEVSHTLHLYHLPICLLTCLTH